MTREGCFETISRLLSTWIGAVTEGIEDLPL